MPRPGRNVGAERAKNNYTRMFLVPEEIYISLMKQLNAPLGADLDGLNKLTDPGELGKTGARLTDSSSAHAAYGPGSGGAAEYSSTALNDTAALNNASIGARESTDGPIAPPQDDSRGEVEMEVATTDGVNNNSTSQEPNSTIEPHVNKTGDGDRGGDDGGDTVGGLPSYNTSTPIDAERRFVLPQERSSNTTDTLAAPPSAVSGIAPPAAGGSARAHILGKAERKLDLLKRKKHVCEICTKAFTSKYSRSRHIASQHAASNGKKKVSAPRAAPQATPRATLRPANKRKRLMTPDGEEIHHAPAGKRGRLQRTRAPPREKARREDARARRMRAGKKRAKEASRAATAGRSARASAALLGTARPRRRRHVSTDSENDSGHPSIKRVKYGRGKPLDSLYKQITPIFVEW